MGATRRKLREVHRRWREFKLVVRGLASTRHPVAAHIIPIRRCNLSCTYCNEFDSTSPPVPLPLLIERVDRLGELGTSVITISGGEPMLHG
ncbi:MAG: radical SAM protein, partial [Bryobacterales bacterium]|nr:radical SAM protein [Bryobacterales bacterium]